MIDRNRMLGLLKQTEGLRLEFKQAHDAIPENVYETICAMLNRDGGDIFLGVSDSGRVLGIKPESVAGMTQNLIDSTNNAQKLNPPFLLQPIVHTIENKSILQIQVPASSQVHRTNKGIYDRSREGDYLLKEPFLISEMYNRKRNYYTEGIIYPQAGMDALSPRLFTYARALIRSTNPKSPLADPQRH